MHTHTLTLCSHLASAGRAPPVLLLLTTTLAVLCLFHKARWHRRVHAVLVIRARALGPVTQNDVVKLQQHKHNQTVLILLFMRACTVSTWGRYTGGCHYIAAALCMCIYVRLAVTVDEHRRCLCIWRVPCQTYRIYTLYM